MTNNVRPHPSQNIFQQQPKSVINRAEHGAVGQDKHRGKSARIASPQPAPHDKVMRPHQLNPNGTRSKSPLTPKRKTVHTTLWLRPIIKAELQRIAAQEGLSVSKVGSEFLERALQQHVDMRYSALLEPIIKEAIRKEIHSYSTRLAWLLVRVAFDTGQTRSLVTNLLGRQPGVNEEVLKNILARTQQLAKGNITRKTPQLRELMEALEKWLDEKV